MKKTVAIHCSPCSTRNTAALVSEAAKIVEVQCTERAAMEFGNK